MTRVVSLMLVLAACSTQAPTPAPPAPAPAIPGPGMVPIAAATRWPVERPACPVPAAPRTSWVHTRSAVVAAAGAPRHVAADLVVAPDTAPRFDGKFAYGTLSKDLEDERVQVFLANPRCEPIQILPAPVQTDDDGRVSADGALMPAGFYHLWLVATADGTHAEAGVWQLPGPTPAVLFDVDGTLTVDDGELFEDLLGGTAQVFAGAAAVAHRWAAKGYLIVYVTGRPYPLRAHTRRWLEANGFPHGPLFTPDRLRAGVPSAEGVGAYKREILTELQRRGVTFARAYGNAATDVCAYVQAGIAPERTWIVGNRPGCDGHPAPHPLASYVDHLADVERQPDVAPPR